MAMMGDLFTPTLYFPFYKRTLQEVEDELAQKKEEIKPLAFAWQGKHNGIPGSLNKEDEHKLRMLVESERRLETTIERMKNVYALSYKEQKQLYNLTQDELMNLVYQNIKITSIHDFVHTKHETKYTVPFYVYYYEVTLFNFTTSEHVCNWYKWEDTNEIADEDFCRDMAVYPMASSLYYSMPHRYKWDENREYKSEKYKDVECIWDGWKNLESKWK